MVNLRAIRLLDIQQHMPGFGAEMRHIHHRRGIIRAQGDLAPRGQSRQTFAQSQNGQGAQQPGRGDLIHTAQIGPCARAVHRPSRAHIRICERRPGDAAAKLR